MLIYYRILGHLLAALLHAILPPPSPIAGL